MALIVFLNVRVYVHYIDVWSPLIYIIIVMIIMIVIIIMMMIIKLKLDPGQDARQRVDAAGPEGAAERGLRPLCPRTRSLSSRRPHCTRAL